MAHVTGSIRIAASQERVFDTVADSRNEPSFNPAMTEAELLTPEPIGLGSRFRARMGSTGMDMLVELTEFDRPHRLGSVTTSSMMETSGTLTVTTDADASVMVWDWQVRPKGWFRMLGPLVGPMGRRMERKIWTGLKRRLEAEPSLAPRDQHERRGGAEMSAGATGSDPIGAEWRGLIRLGAAAAVFVLVMIPVQAAVFILSPPPSTVEGFFALFQENPLLGLLDLDLLLTLDYLVMIPFYLALYVVIRRTAPAWGLLALIVGLFSLVLLVVSREATFSMWMLSDQYAAAISATDKAALLAAGTSVLSLYNGGTFATSYVLGAISTLLFSATMVRHRVFGRLPGLVGVVTGLTMLVPANAGPVGLTIAMLSLLPTAVWLLLLIPHLLRVARETPVGQHTTSKQTRPMRGV